LQQTATAAPLTDSRVAGASRRGQIDALRILAVVWVLFDHFWLAAGSGPMGRLSVRLFLLISGYLITHILLRSRDAMEAQKTPLRQVLTSFYARRALRIAPAYYLLIFLTWQWGAEDFQGSLPWLLSFQSSVLFAKTQSWGPPYQLAHLWTLSVQEQFYLLWPVIVLLVRKGALGLWVAAIAATGPVFRVVMVMLGLDDTAGAYTLLPSSATALCIGAAAAMLERRRAVPGWFAGSRPWWLIGAAVAFAVVTVADWPDRLHYLLVEFLWLPPLAALLLSAAKGIEGPVGRVLDQRWLQYLGRISLGVYLYQNLANATAKWLLANAGLPTANGPAAFFATSAFSILFALVSWKLLEQPVNGWKRLFPYPWAGRAGAKPAPAPAWTRSPEAPPVEAA
jgi:peptidoglycan/LPS O-acetylase OafA/YrhL